MPRRDQSGRRHVSLVGSKMSTPLQIALMMAHLNDWKAASRVEVHSKRCLGLRNCLML